MSSAEKRREEQSRLHRHTQTQTQSRETQHCTTQDVVSCLVLSCAPLQLSAGGDQSEIQREREIEREECNTMHWSRMECDGTVWGLEGAGFDLSILHVT